MLRIIAVVIAGLIHGLERDRLIRKLTNGTTMNYHQIWNTFSYALKWFLYLLY